MATAMAAIIVDRSGLSLWSTRQSHITSAYVRRSLKHRHWYALGLHIASCDPYKDGRGITKCDPYMEASQTVILATALTVPQVVILAIALTVPHIVIPATYRDARSAC
jgi:hypothetical protein